MTRASVIYPTYVHDLVEGVSKNVHHLREALCDRGVDAVDDSPRVDVADMNSKKVYVRQGVAAYRKVREALRDPTVDVVHYHVSIPGMAAWAALARARVRSDKPLVLHMWNPWYDAADAHAAATRERFYQSVFNAPATTTPFLRAFDAIVVSSEYQRRQLAERGFEASVVSNGVDVESYRPPPKPTTKENARRELGLPVDRTLLLYYGHLTPWKGARVLVEALPRAFADSPDADLVIAHTSYGREAQAIRDRLVELKLHHRVHFLGVCDVPLLLQAVDAGVVPATAAVGTACHPNVVLEYQSAGVPIVASRVGSIPEALVDERTGLLAAPGDAADLAAKLSTLLCDESARRKLGAAARVRAEREYGWRGIARQYEDVYRLAMDAARRVPERTRPAGGASPRRNPRKVI